MELFAKIANGFQKTFSANMVSVVVIVVVVIIAFFHLEIWNLQSKKYPNFKLSAGCCII